MITITIIITVGLVYIGYQDFYVYVHLCVCVSAIPVYSTDGTPTKLLIHVYVCIYVCGLACFVSVCVSFEMRRPISSCSYLISTPSYSFLYAMLAVLLLVFFLLLFL